MRRRTASAICAPGCAVDYDALTPDLLRGVGSRPAAVVVDLSRLPTHGRGALARENKGYPRRAPRLPDRPGKWRRSAPCCRMPPTPRGQCDHHDRGSDRRLPLEPLVPSERSRGIQDPGEEAGHQAQHTVVLIDAPKDFEDAGHSPRGRRATYAPPRSARSPSGS
jgi:hypothetical protein